MRKFFKKALALAAAATLSLSLCVGCSEEASTSGGSSSGASSSDTVTYGFVMPLTGSVPNIGAAMKNGAALAVEEINAAGGVLGKQITAIYEDDENKPATAPNAITKLITEDKVDVVLGTYASSCSMAMAPVAEENKTLMMSIGSTNSKVTEGYNYVYRACFIDPLQGKVGAEYVYNSIGATSAAVMYDVGKDYCVGISSTFTETYTGLGGTIAYEGKYNTGESDFKSYLTEVKNSGATVLYIPDDYDVVGLIAKQVKELGIDIQLMSSDSCSDPGLIEVGGDAVEGCYFTDHVSIQAENLADFVAAYKAKYNEDPGSFAVLGYDAVYIVKAAMEKAGSADSDAVIAALKELNEKCGTTTYSFDDKGDPVKSVVINQVKDGGFEYVDEVAPN